MFKYYLNTVGHFIFQKLKRRKYTITNEAMKTYEKYIFISSKIPNQSFKHFTSTTIILRQGCMNKRNMF